MSRHAGPILIDFDIVPVVLRVSTRQNTAFVNGRRASRADLAAATLTGRAGERNHAKAAIAVANPSFLLAENSVFALDIVVAPVMT